MKICGNLLWLPLMVNFIGLRVARLVKHTSLPIGTSVGDFPEDLVALKTGRVISLADCPDDIKAERGAGDGLVGTVITAQA